jgi:hypothetical protein
MLGKLIIITLYVYTCIPLSNGGKKEYLERAGTASFEVKGSFINTDSLIRETVKKYGVDLRYNSITTDIETLRIKCECN